MEGPPAPPGESVLCAGMAVGPNDRFVLLDRLGQGGMGEVWLANDQALSQEGEPHFVALKFLSEAIRHEPRALASLRAEVLRSQQLSHPNIVHIFDLHTTRDGTPFIKMEFVEGNSVARWLEEAPGHVMPWKMVAQLSEQLAAALFYAHETVGIVHRDIKPSNLLLGEGPHGPVVKLSDFGIARAVNDPLRPEMELVAMGTLWYSSPQQIMGQPATPADDIYALGATWYELLTGTPPFDADSPERLAEQINTEPIEPIPRRLDALGRRNEVPHRLANLVHSCLEKDPAYRPKTRELIRLLPPGGVGGSFEAGATRARLPESGQWEEPVGPAKSAGGMGVWLLVMALAAGAAWWQNWGDIRARLDRWLRPQDGADQRDMANQPPPPMTTHFTNQGVATAPVEIPDVPADQPDTTARPSPAPAEVTGAVRVTLDSDDRRQLRHSYRLLNREGTVVASNTLQPGVMEFTATELRPGPYQLEIVELTRDRDWVMREPLAIEANRTTELKFAFARNAELTVDSTPPGAWVQWPPGCSLSSPILSNQTPFSHRFASGVIPFTVRLAGHLDVQTNYLFNPAVSQVLRLSLTRSPYPRRGETWTNSLGMVFHWLPRLSNWVCATETSVGQFRQFVEASGHFITNDLWSLTATGAVQIGFSWRNPGFAQTDNHPVVAVNWHDAARFCDWLTARELAGGGLAQRQGYRLPTTNEWCALAGGRFYPWGDAAGDIRGNYAGHEVQGPQWPANWSVLDRHDGYPRTAPVWSAATAANEFGLHHVGGNVAEWCQEQVLCGGSWRHGDSNALHKLATRELIVLPPSERHDFCGFRLVLFQND